ncbi:MAG: MMPL family transporter [Candidatus Tectomicrobia bacterium]|uniref:MMPL family transporter n=1 Tax=Tectimicrobiota bacterium TaxID=2528274 RepID=A0A932CMH0_UNCTE|nr:MMPL family transporter [Candidatus Tectomicrobia bacterium]
MSFTHSFARLVIRFRWPVVLLVLAMTAFFTYQLRHMSLPEELADIAPQGHPFVQLQHHMGQVFGVGSMVVIALELREGGEVKDIFNPLTLGKLRRIGERISHLRGVIRGQVISMATHSRVKNIRTTLDEEGYSTIVAESFKDLSAMALASPEAMAEFRQTIVNHEQLYGSLVSWDKRSTVILAHFWDERDFKVLFEEIRKILQAEEDPEHRFHLAGRIVEMGWLHRFMKEILLYFGVATALIILVLFAAFGTWRGMLMPLWAAYVAVVWGLGAESLLGFKTDILTILVPFMIMAIEVSHSIQILSRFYEEYERWGDGQKAAEETLKGLLLPGVASIITDGAGFATLFLIPFKLLQQMAFSASFGVLRIFFTTTIFIHAFIAILPPPTRKEMEKIRRRNRLFQAALGQVADLTWGRGRWAVVLAAGLLGLVGMIGVERVVVGDLMEGSPLFWADSEYNRAERVINRLSGTHPYLIHIAGGGSGALADPQTILDTNRLQRHLEERPDIKGSSSYSEILKGVNMAYHNNDPRWYVLPKDRMAAYQYLYLFKASGGVEDSMGYFEIDLSEGSLTLYARDHRAETIRSLIQDTEQFLKLNQKSAARIEQAGGVIGIFSAIMDVIQESQVESLGQISLAVFLFCMLTFRSIVAGLIIMIPLAMGTIITFATMGFAEIGLFLYTVPVASLGMGLGVDYSLYIVSRMREESVAGKAPQEIHYRALTHAGQAVSFVALSIMTGVAALLLSSIRFQAILGGMLMVIILANFLGAIFLLPALINWWRPKFLFGGQGS